MVRDFDIYSCESPDVVCHELGHAILDALRPQLFNVANIETAAFHEAFGDMSAILCALQIPEMRDTIIRETGGRLNTNSRFSRLAEQLGWGLRQMAPEIVDRDCLRNAANRFFYKRPDLLPPVADAGMLSSEEHSFSRVFTGAFLDALARMFSAGPAQDAAALVTLSRNMGQLLIDAVHGAPVTAAYFNQVAAAMIQADQARFAGLYKAQLTGAFLEHGILSVDSSLQLAAAPVPAPVSFAASAAAAAGGPGASVLYSYHDRQDDDAHQLGLGETPELPLRPLSLGNGLSLEVHSPEDQPRFAVASAAFGPNHDDPAMGEDAATRSFVVGLIQRQQVDLAGANKYVTGAGRKHAGRTTHELVSEGGKNVLKRRYFACCCGPRASAQAFCD
jgi:hypothetical protein